MSRAAQSGCINARGRSVGGFAPQETVKPATRALLRVLRGRLIVSESEHPRAICPGSQDLRLLSRHVEALPDAGIVDEFDIAPFLHVSEIILRRSTPLQSRRVVFLRDKDQCR